MLVVIFVDLDLRCAAVSLFRFIEVFIKIVFAAASLRLHSSLLFAAANGQI